MHDGPNGTSAGWGPTSRKTSMPSACRAPSPSAKRTGSRAWRAQYAGVTSPAPTTRPLTLETRAMRGSRCAMPAASAPRARERGLDHGRVERVRHRQRPDADAVALERRAHRADRLHRARQHDLTRRVHRGDRHVGSVGRQARRHLRLGHPHRGHRPLRQGIHDPPAERDEARGVGQREDAGHAGRRVLAQAVADHGRGLDALGAPHGGQRVLDGEHRGLSRRGPPRAPPVPRRPGRGCVRSGRSRCGSSAAAHSSSARRNTGSLS